MVEFIHRESNFPPSAAAFCGAVFCAVAILAVVKWTAINFGPAGHEAIAAIQIAQLKIIEAEYEIARRGRTKERLDALGAQAISRGDCASSGNDFHTAGNCQLRAIIFEEIPSKRREIVYFDRVYYLNPNICWYCSKRFLYIGAKLSAGTTRYFG